jgi:hypothetical protein
LSEIAPWSAVEWLLVIDVIELSTGHLPGFLSKRSRDCRQYDQRMQLGKNREFAKPSTRGPTQENSAARSCRSASVRFLSCKQLTSCAMTMLTSGIEHLFHLEYRISLPRIDVIRLYAVNKERPRLIGEAVIK